MGFLSILKLLGFLLWPVLFLMPYYFVDKEKFKQRLKEVLKPPK